MWKGFMARGVILVVAWVACFSMDVSALSRYMAVITYYNSAWFVFQVGQEVRDCHGVSESWGTTTMYEEVELLSCNGGPEPDPVCYIGGIMADCFPVPDYCYPDWGNQIMVCSR